MCHVLVQFILTMVLAGSRVHFVEIVLTRGFALPPLVDRLMGTFKLPRDCSWPQEYGVLKPETVPAGIWRKHLMPFRAGKTRPES